MNVRLLPILGLVIWSLICWRWYVCGIKQVCSPETVNAASVIQPQPVTPAIEPETAPVITPAHDAPADKASTDKARAGASTVQKTLSNSIEEAQVVAVADHVLIHFPYGSTRKEDDTAINAYLTELAQALVESGGTVTLTGHTDGIGDPASNQKMALQRANHIKSILVKKGVAASKIKCLSKGEAKPIDTNDNPRGRYLNRRVEVRLGK